ncbi:cyclin-SDS-like [Aristolochia californica]|uniref:cyclin-SDS-like n=1 Tax=Aristolochia californica TaxID=171875 RepID=UPI0035D99E5C
MPSNVNLVLRLKNPKKWRNFEQVSLSRKPRSKIPRLKRVPQFMFPDRTSEEKFGEAKMEFSASSTSSQLRSASCNSGVIWVRPEKSKKRARNPRQEKENDDVGGVLDIESEADDLRTRTRSHCRKRRSARSVVNKGKKVCNVDLSENSCVDSVSARDDGNFGNSKVLSQGKLKPNENPCQIVRSAEEDEKSTLEVLKLSRQEDVSRLRRAKDYSEAFTNQIKVAPESPQIQGKSASIIAFSESSCLESACQNKIAQNVCQTGPDGSTQSNFDEITIEKKLEDNFECDSDLACSEKLTVGDETDYETCEELTSSDLEKELSPRSPDADTYFSDFSLSSLSSSDLCKISGETSVQSASFSLNLQFSKQFVRLTGLSKPTKECSDEFTLLRLEEEEHEESYQMFRCWERRHVPPHDYTEDYRALPEYGEMVLHQRLLMVHWIIQHAGLNGLHCETLFLGVSLLDRFLREGFFQSKKNLQLLGIACCTLATRIEEKQPLNSIREMIFQVGSNTYSRCEVVAMEWLVQEILHFKCLLPTIYNFLWFYLKAAKADTEVERITRYLALLSLLDHERLSFWSSTVAAGLVILASLAANCESSCHHVIETHVRTKNDDLPECIESLEWLIKYVC